MDRAVRADVEDSVHQMRVTIRTIRSLLQASASVFGLTDDARGDQRDPVGSRRSHQSRCGAANRPRYPHRRG